MRSGRMALTRCSAVSPITMECPWKKGAAARSYPMPGPQSTIFPSAPFRLMRTTIFRMRSARSLHTLGYGLGRAPARRGRLRPERQGIVGTEADLLDDGRYRSQQRILASPVSRARPRLTHPQYVHEPALLDVGVLPSNASSATEPVYLRIVLVSIDYDAVEKSIASDLSLYLENNRRPGLGPSGLGG